MKRIPRDAEPLVRHLASDYPLVAITGPRQSGKTSLARHLFPHLPYRNLERPDLRQFVSSDPLGFLAKLGEGQLASHPLRGASFESWVAGEWLKWRANHGSH